MILKWLPCALQDRDAQLDYITQDNPRAAVSPTAVSAERSLVYGDREAATDWLLTLGLLS